MSDRDQLLSSAALVLLIFGILVWAIVGVGWMVRTPMGTEFSAAQLARQACGGAAAASASNPDSGLCAQYIAAAATHRAADLTQWQTWIGLCGLVGVIVTLFLNWRATRAATEQAAVARREFEWAQKPAFAASLKGISESQVERASTNEHQPSYLEFEPRQEKVQELLMVTQHSGRANTAISLHVYQALTRGDPPSARLAATLSPANELGGLRPLFPGATIEIYVGESEQTMGAIEDSFSLGYRFYIIAALVYEDVDQRRIRGFRFEPILVTDPGDWLAGLSLQIFGGFNWKLTESFDERLTPSSV